MQELIELWRKEFGLIVKTGDFSKQNLYIFVRLYLEETMEVLDEILADGEIKDKVFANMKYIKDNPPAFCKEIENINQDNLTKELVDSEYITYGHGFMQLGLDQDVSIKVYQSNMSKLCDTKEDAIRSCTSMNPHIKKEDLPYAGFVRTPSGKFKIINKETGKVLKGIHYKKWYHF